jgi:hypothetical protein
MIPITTNKRILELYSSRRNRNIYPNPSSFEVNFAPTYHASHCEEKEIKDIVCKGAIYYSLSIPNQIIFSNTNYFLNTNSFFLEGSTRSNPILYLNELLNEANNPVFPQTVKNYYVGYIIFKKVNFVLTESRIVRSWDPSTNTITMDRPFDTDIIINNEANGFSLVSNLPQTWSIYLPTIDDNNIGINKNPLYYNGYYLVFETNNPNYSNSSNSNIFSRRISYYDSVRQIAYFDEPLPFSYSFSDRNSQLQKFTIRKSLPNERWKLNKKSYFKTTYPDNPIEGPLQGYVVILPDDANSIDNYYQGKYLYVVSNNANVYSPPLPPQSNILQPIDNSFYPIYGLFYIKAYNGKTKELSIENINNKYKNLSENIPTSYALSDINSSSFKIVPDSNITQIINVSNGVYRIYPESVKNNRLYLSLEKSKKYNITFRVRSNIGPTGPGIVGTYLRLTVSTQSSSYFDANQIAIPTIYYTYNFDMTTSPDNGDVVFSYESIGGSIGFIYAEWNLLNVVQYDTVNIVDLEYDNCSPLDYNGTIVSTNQTVCYEMSIESISLPNKQLLTGSSIAFYPFVYIQIENSTSSGTAPNIIISNNPPSTKAIFTVYIPQVDNPDIQRFVTLTGGGTQIVKFKPNDNLRFSVYLPDGSKFETLFPDTLSPYPPDPSLQIHAVFNLIRLN